MIRNDIETIRSIIRKYMLMIPTARLNENMNNTQNSIRNALLNPVDYIMTSRSKHAHMRTMPDGTDNVIINTENSYQPNTLSSNSDLVIMNMLSDIRNVNIDYSNDLITDEHDDDMNDNEVFRNMVIDSINGFIRGYSYNDSDYYTLYKTGMLMSISRLLFHNLRIRRIMMMHDADIIAFNAVLRTLHMMDLIIVNMAKTWGSTHDDRNCKHNDDTCSVRISSIEKAAVMLVQGYPDEFIMEVLKASL